MQAPTGFIIQLSFLDFELEEAPGCKYDWVMVNAGHTETRFCGLTANGMTLNSSGNVMELSFTSDFSIQKKGFSVSYQHGTFRSPTWSWSSKLIQSFHGYQAQIILTVSHALSVALESYLQYLLR